MMAGATTGNGIVVCGAGVIGVCTAYFLGQRGVKVTLVDNCGIAAAASGKAGGFLALDWCDGSPVGKLARQSFKLHQLLADDLGGAQKYGYRRLETLSVVVEEDKEASGGRRERKQGSGVAVPAWVDGKGVKKARSIGNEASTAQVHPGMFTRTLFERCQSDFGAQFLKGKVEEVRVEAGASRVVGVVVDGRLVPADCVVVALGPWSSRLKLVTEVASVRALKAHSIVLKEQQGRSDGGITPHALFLNFTTREGRLMDPEVYPRPNGEVYICGMTEEDAELPLDADAVVPTRGATTMLARVAAEVSSSLEEAVASVEQACFLPLSPDGLPLIGKVPGVEGAYIATGHSCWGILNAPATGSAMAELILTGETGILKPFDPARFAQ